MGTVLRAEESKPAATVRTSDIVFDNIRRVFQRDGKDFITLDGVDLHVRDKEFIAVVGPSGCGKTTLMPWQPASSFQRPAR